MKRHTGILITLIIILFSGGEAISQGAPLQRALVKRLQYLDTLKQSQIYKVAYIATPFIVSGIVLYTPGKRFRDLRNGFAPNFYYRADDYIQYIPTAMLYSLKAGGVEGRSTWGRLLTTHALSAVSMAILVNGIKYSVKEARPDNSANNGFPSGHTALAFMSANMVHHEYGLTRSPWYSIGAYSIAASTAVIRVLNDKHYLQDVLFGAGIGILSTELGYYFSDLIFKKRGLLLGDNNYSYSYQERPGSYIGMTLGFNKTFNLIPVTSTVNLKSTWGTSSGIEGVCYLNRNWGIAGSLTANSSPTQVVRGSFRFSGPHINWFTLSGGPNYSYPVRRTGRIGGKIAIGYSGLIENSFNGYTITASKGLSLSGGIFAEQHITQGLFFKLYTNIEKTFFNQSKYNFLNLVSGASVNIDLGVL
ncbi:MAG: phosphatase PAP2 family protein [Bacteroidales bacterium]